MLHGLRGRVFHMRCGFFYFWPRARPENPTPSSPAFFVLSPGPIGVCDWGSRCEYAGCYAVLGLRRF